MNLRKVAMIVACLAVTVMFAACDNTPIGDDPDDPDTPDTPVVNGDALLDARTIVSNLGDTYHIVIEGFTYDHYANLSKSHITIEQNRTKEGLSYLKTYETYEPGRILYEGTIYIFNSNGYDVWNYEYPWWEPYQYKWVYKYYSDYNPEIDRYFYYLGALAQMFSVKDVFWDFRDSPKVKVGEEKIAGRDCNIYKDGRYASMEPIIKIWVDKKTGFPLKCTLEDKSGKKYEKSIGADPDVWECKVFQIGGNVSLPKG